MYNLKYSINIKQKCLYQNLLIILGKSFLKRNLEQSSTENCEQRFKITKKFVNFYVFFYF